MNDLEIMKSYCNKCKHKGTCTTICPTVWFAVLQRERSRQKERASDDKRRGIKSVGADVLRNR